MPLSVSHQKTATTPDNPSYEIRPSDWNSNHVATLSAVGSEIIGAFSNSNNVSLGLALAGVITLSASFPVQTAQTLQVVAVGNTTINNSSTIDARSIVVSGAGIVSVGVVGNDIIISATGGGVGGGVAVAAGTNVQTSGTAAFGNANNVTFGMDTAGNVTASASYSTGINFSASNAAALLSSVVLGNANGVSFGLIGNTITASVAPPTGISGVNISAGGVAANLSQLSFQNSNGIAFGLNASSITASYTVPSTTGLISGVLFSAGTNVTTLSSIVFSNANGVSFGILGSNITASVSQSNQTLQLNAYGNSTQTSTGTLDARSLNISGAGIVSVGYSANSIIISAVGTGAAGGPAIAAGTNTINNGTVAFINSNGFTFGMNTNSQITATFTPGAAAGIAAVIAGTFTQTNNTLSFQNSNGISFGISASTLTASYTVPSQTVQPVAASGSNASALFSTLSFGNSNGLTFYITNGSMVGSYTVPTQTTQPVAVSGSNGSLAFSTLTLGNLNGLSFYTSNGSIVGSYTVPNTAAALTAINISAGLSASNLSAVTFSNSNGMVFGLSNGVVTASANNANINISAGTQANAVSGFTLSNSNNVSFGLNASVVTASASFPAQTAQTVGLYARGNTTNASSTTFDARSLSFSGAGNISVGISAGAVVISDTGGGGLNSASLYAVSNTTQSTSGTVALSALSFQGAGAVSIGVSNGSVVISAQAGAQSVQTVGLYANGNTTGTSSTTYDARFVTLYGAGMVTVGNSNGSIVISAPQTTTFSPLSAGMSNIGNTVGTTGLASNQLVLAGGANVTLSGSTNAGSMTISISANAGGGGGASTVGIYAQSNTTGQSSSSTLALSSLNIQGAGIISVGMSSNSLIISAPGSTGISQSIYVAGNTTQSSSGTQNLGVLTVQGAGNVSVGVSNGSLVVSGVGGGGGVNFGISTGGNTAGATGTVSTGNVVLVGLGPISLSQATGAAGSAATISINAPATSSLVGTNGISISTNGSTISVSQISPTIYASSNTMGQSSSSTYPPTSLSIVGSGNLSLGWSNSSLIFSVAPGAAQTGISGIVVSNTTYTSGTVSFSNANGISFGSSAGQAITASYTVPSQVSLFALGNTTQNSSTVLGFNALSFDGLGEATVGFSNGSIQISAPPSSLGVSTGGNTLGNTGTYSGQMVLQGGNNVTLSVSTAAGGAQTIVVSGVNTVAQTNQTVGLYAIGNTTQNSSTTLDARTLSFNGLGAVTAGFSNGSIQLSVPVLSVGVSNLGNTSGTTGTQSGQLILAGGNNITLSVSTAAGGAQSITISGPNVGGAQTGISSIIVSNTTYTSGAVSFSNANGISFGSSAGQAITASYTVPAQVSLFALGNTTQSSSTVLGFGALSFNGLGEATIGFSNGSIQVSVPPSSIGVSNIGNTLGNTGTFSGQVVLAGGANVTLSVGTAAGGAQTITVSAAAQTNQNLSLFALGNTTQNSSTVLGAAALSLNGLGIVTVGYSNGSIQVSATQSNQAFSASGGSSAFQTLVFTNSNNITFTNTGGSLAASYALNVSAGGGTSNALSAITFANSNSITFGLSTGVGVGTITASYSQTVQNISMFALGNTTQNSSTVLPAQLSLNGLGAMTVGYTNGSIQISAPATSSLVGASGISVSLGASTISIYEIARSRVIMPLGQNLTALSAPGQGSVSIQYVPLDTPVSASRLDALVSWAAGSAATSNTMGIALSVWAGVYTLNGSTLSSLSSGSTQTTYTYASNTAGQTQLITGAMRPISCPVNIVMSQGEYYVAFNFSTNSTSVGANTTNLGQTLSIMGGNQLQTSAVYAEFTNQTASSSNLYGGMGVYTAQTAGLPAAISLSAIAQTGSSLSQANIALVFRNF
jgi:hypothetical protein